MSKNFSEEIENFPASMTEDNDEASVIVVGYSPECEDGIAVSAAGDWVMIPTMVGSMVAELVAMADDFNRDSMITQIMLGLERGVEGKGPDAWTQMITAVSGALEDME